MYTFEGEDAFIVDDAILLVCGTRRHLVAIDDGQCGGTAPVEDLCAWALVESSYTEGMPCAFAVGAFERFGVALHLDSAHQEGMAEDVATGTYWHCELGDRFVSGMLTAIELSTEEWAVAPQVDLDIEGASRARHCGDPR